MRLIIQGDSMKVDNLTRVSVDIKMSDPLQTVTAEPAGNTMEFIFGIGRDGLCPFESQLQYTSVGDTIARSVNSLSGPDYFGHLYPLACGFLDLPEVPGIVDLKISVAEISRPDNREIVEAMARSVGHGCGGGSCDCGCS